MHAWVGLMHSDIVCTKLFCSCEKCLFCLMFSCFCILLTYLHIFDTNKLQILINLISHPYTHIIVHIHMHACTQMQEQLATVGSSPAICSVPFCVGRHSWFCYTSKHEYAIPDDISILCTNCFVIHFSADCVMGRFVIVKYIQIELHIKQVEQAQLDLELHVNKFDQSIQVLSDIHSFFEANTMPGYDILQSINPQDVQQSDRKTCSSQTVTRV